MSEKLAYPSLVLCTGPSPLLPASLYPRLCPVSAQVCPWFRRRMMQRMHALAANDAAQQAEGATPPAALKSTRVIAGLLSVLLGIASVAIIAMNLIAGRQTEYLALSLEACGLLAGVVGWFFYRGKYSQGPGMALACVAGTFFTVAVLSGWVALRREMQLANGSALNLSLLTYARVALSLAVAGLGAFEVLRRNHKSFAYLVRAAATLGPLGLLALGMYAGRAGLAAGTLLGASWLTWTVTGLAVVLLMALACAGLHFVIRAFEAGRASQAGGGAS